LIFGFVQPLSANFNFVRLSCYKETRKGASRPAVRLEVAGFGGTVISVINKVKGQAGALNAPPSCPLSRAKAPAKTKKMSAAAKAKLSALAKARWAKVKKAGKESL
jgi:hypothetical protein